MVAETGESSADHASNTGWYSHRILAGVLQGTIPPLWRLQLPPMDPTDFFQFCQDDLIYGALVNQNGQHWTAIVKHSGLLCHVDSLHSPKVLSDDGLAALLDAHPETYPLLDNEHPL